MYKEINNAPGIKFPIKVNIALPEHKRSLIIQAELGGLEFPAGEQFTKHKRQFQQDKAILFLHAHRLIRCIVDCQLVLQDSITTRHALELARSFGARVWDNSPLQMKQIPQIGAVAVRKLAVAGINSIEVLEATEAHRLETILNKQVPSGTRILANLKDFPKLRVYVRMMGKVRKTGHTPQRAVPLTPVTGLQIGTASPNQADSRDWIHQRQGSSFLSPQAYICVLSG